jgi:hypothetical protein
MSQCERSEVCVFFNKLMEAMPVSADLFRDNYCKSNKLDCARYMIHQKLRAGYVPEDDARLQQMDREMKRLYPNNMEGAKRIIGWLVKY